MCGSIFKNDPRTRLSALVEFMLLACTCKKRKRKNKSRASYEGRELVIIKGRCETWLCRLHRPVRWLFAFPLARQTCNARIKSTRKRIKLMIRSCIRHTTRHCVGGENLLIEQVYTAINTGCESDHADRNR